MVILFQSKRVSPKKLNFDMPTIYIGFQINLSYVTTFVTIIIFHHFCFSINIVIIHYKNNALKNINLIFLL